MAGVAAAGATSAEIAHAAWMDLKGDAPLRNIGRHDEDGRESRGSWANASGGLRSVPQLDTSLHMTGHVPRQGVPRRVANISGYTGHIPRKASDNFYGCGFKRGNERAAASASRTRRHQLQRTLSAPDCAGSSGHRSQGTSAFQGHKLYEAAFGRKPFPLPPDMQGSGAWLGGAIKPAPAPTITVPPLDRRVSLLQGGERDCVLWRNPVHRDIEACFRRGATFRTEAALAAAYPRPRPRPASAPAARRR